MTGARGALLALLLALAACATLALRDGVALDTRFADLVPDPYADGVTPADAAAQRLAERVERFAADSVRFVLIGPADAPLRLRAAREALEQRLDALPGVRRLDADTRFQALIERLEPHRFSLLPARLLGPEPLDGESLAEDAIAALYGPGVETRPLPLERDPLNLFGAWLTSLPGLAATGAAVHERTGEPPFAIVDLSLDAGSNLASGHEAVAGADALERVRHAVLEGYPDVQVLRTGVAFFAREANAASRTDIDRIGIGSLLGLLILLLPVFRSFWPLLLPGLSIAIGAATGAALVWLVHGSMHVLTLVFGASLIGIVIDYSVHGYAHTLGTAGASGTRALDPRLRRALLLSLATSALGYAALGLSSIDALSRVALFSVGGLSGAWLCVVALLPLTVGRGARLHLDPLERPVDALQRVGRRLASALLARPLVASLALVALAAAVLIGSRADDDPRRLIDLSPELIEDARAIAGFDGDSDVARRLQVTAADADAAFTALRALAAALPDDIEVQGLADRLPSPEDQALARERYAGLLAADGAAATVLAALGETDPEALLVPLRRALAREAEMPLGGGETLATLLAEPTLGLPPLFEALPGAVATVALVTRDADPAALARAVAKVNGDIARDADGNRAATSVRLLDGVADTARELGAQRRSAHALLLAATLAIALLLLLVYRRLAALRLLAVPTVSILLTVAVFTLLGTPLTLFHAVGLFLVLGLGMDYTIFVAELERSAPRTTHAAIVLSAATSLVSFGLLAASSIPVARFFGQTVLIGNAFNLLLTFVLLGLMAARDSTLSRAAPRSARC